jgi:hypothetical protein
MGIEFGGTAGSGETSRLIFGRLGSLEISGEGVCNGRGSDSDRLGTLVGFSSGILSLGMSNDNGGGAAVPVRGEVEGASA